MAVAPGGMPEPRTCTLLFLNPTFIAVNSCRCGINGSVFSGLLEPPYTEPYVRWCGRTAEVTPPPRETSPMNPTIKTGDHSMRGMFSLNSLPVNTSRTILLLLLCVFASQAQPGPRATRPASAEQRTARYFDSI